MDGCSVIAFVVGGVLCYAMLAAFAGMLPIESPVVRALAMALWPITVALAILWMPVLIFRAVEEDRRAAKALKAGTGEDAHKRLREKWRSRYQGTKNRFEVPE